MGWIYFHSKFPFSLFRPVWSRRNVEDLYVLTVFQPRRQPQQPSGPLFTKTTKFNDLPDEVKKKLESIE